jgi:hypothetical protein
LVLRETPHLRLISDRQLAPRLDSLAALSESLWQELSKVTGYSPKDRIILHLRDEDDYSNGWAYASNSWVNVWLTPTQFDLRDGTDWERNVIAHEMGHVFTLQALGYDGHLSSIGAGGEIDRSTRTLDAGLTLTFNRCEAWLAEGMAQLASQLCGGDRWGPRRDMLERIAWENDRLLKDGELRAFWGDGRENEEVYAQGYSFLRFVLAKGRLDYPALLREGRRTSLRQAVESSLGMSFEKALAAWRSDVGIRQAPRQMAPQDGGFLLPPPSAATWTVQASAVGTAAQRWLLSSHGNDYGDLELWELGERKRRKLAEHLQGRLHLSQDGRRLLMVRQETWPDRYQINDLWEYDVMTSSWKRLTEHARVQDGSWFRDGYAAIEREKGHSHVWLLDAEGSRRVQLPDPSSGTAVQIEGTSDGRLWCTIMGQHGYRILAWHETSASWVLDSIEGEAKDPLWTYGKLWFSTIANGRWAAASKDDSVKIIAESDGGMFAPFPLGDSLLVSQYRREGFLVQTVVPKDHARSFQAGDSLTDTANRHVAARLLEPGRGIRPLGLCLPELTAWQLYAGVSANSDTMGRFEYGSQADFGAGVTFDNSKEEVEAGFEYHRLASMPSGEQGHSIVASLNLTAFAPEWSLRVWNQATVMRERYAATARQDTFFKGDTLPILENTGLLAQVLQTFTTSSYGFAYWQYQSVGVGNTVSQGSSLTERTVNVLGLGAGWQDLASGRYGAWQGASLQVSGARVWPWYDPDLNVIGVDYWNVSGTLRLVTNLRRRLIIDWTTQGTWSIPDQYLSPTGTGNSSLSLKVPLPLPSLSLPGPGSRRLTFVNPELSFGPSLRLEPRSLLSNAFAPQSQAAPSPLQNLGEPMSIGNFFPREVRAGGALGANFTVEVITWANILSQWNLGVSIPWARTSQLEEPLWQLSLTL